MGNSKTFNYPKAKSSKTNSQTGNSSRISDAKQKYNQAQNFESNQQK